ncbi:hypothetical protein FPV67DRAFT_1446145 [Lyophyllum atratum]|nr:hypothetical protein FPV67DRAFT_1446145 [Lyophyllum atratum]
MAACSFGALRVRMKVPLPSLTSAVMNYDGELNTAPDERRYQLSDLSELKRKGLLALVQRQRDKWPKELRLNSKTTKTELRDALLDPRYGFTTDKPANDPSPATSITSHPQCDGGVFGYTPRPLSRVFDRAGALYFVNGEPCDPPDSRTASWILCRVTAHLAQVHSAPASGHTAPSHGLHGLPSMLRPLPGKWLEDDLDAAPTTRHVARGLGAP